MRAVAAAFVFFTRLPFWRFRAFRVPAECFAGVIPYWAVVGWLTGGLAAAVLWLAAQVFPYPVAVVFALLSRVVLTGALHEDGLADFLDGFGGGTSRERILAIMKDSHIGTYGVIGLVFYFLLFYQLLAHLPLPVACMGLVAGDPLCKFIASHITFLPYARSREESKSGVVYAAMSWRAWVVGFVFGCMPLLLAADRRWVVCALFPALTFTALLLLMKKRIGGYTGDCCGAMFLLCELSFYAGYTFVGFFA
jgi:adenosylcobinamide-GDP ribazoletransferase